jgi:hypothetical protein
MKSPLAKKEEAKEWARQYRADHPEEVYRAVRKYHLKNTFGITLEQYDEMLLRQGRRCAICKTTDPRGRGKKTTTWDIDHNAETGEVRGLLCHPCNMVLGYYERYSLPVAPAYQEYLDSPPAREVLGEVPPR